MSEFPTTEVISAAAVLTPDGLLADHEVHIVDGAIAAVEPAAGPVMFDLLAPGFVDIQVNGHANVDVARADAAAWRRLAGLLLAQGVTTWCPTLVTSDRSVYGEALARIAGFLELDATGPAVAGIHLEGPYLGRRHGAHVGVPEGPIDVGWLGGLPDLVRVVTLGPERTNAVAATAALVERGVVVGLGHTEASYEETCAAVDAGARLFTHCFNAAGPVHHREPGAVGAALTRDEVVVSLIADGVHVHPAMIDLAFRCKPDDGVVLITDAVGWESGGLGAVAVHHDGEAPRLTDGTLAGSSLTMPAAVANAAALGVDLATALRAASTAPAQLLGLADRGRIAPGLRSDLVALNGDLTVVGTWQGGRRLFAG